MGKYKKIKASATQVVTSDAEEEEVKESDDENLGVLKHSTSYVSEEQDATIGLVSNEDFSKRLAEQSRSRQICLCKFFFFVCTLLITLYAAILLLDLFPIKSKIDAGSSAHGPLPTLTPTGGPVALLDSEGTITPTGGPVASDNSDGGRVYPGLPYGSPGHMTHTPTGGPVSLPQDSMLKEDEIVPSIVESTATAVGDDEEEDAILDPFTLAKINPKRIDFWKKVNAELVDHTKDVLAKNPVTKGTWSWLGKWKEARIDFCTKKNKEEVKKFGKDVFEAPMTDMSSDHFLGFDLDKAIRHVERTIADLCTYYKPLGNECPLSTALSPSLTGAYAKKLQVPDISAKIKQERKALASSLRIHAWRFARKIVYREPLRIGVLGTSVLSGQDNCFRTSYGPGLEKDLRSLLRPAIDVEVRTSAQNGDGPPMYSSMVCSDAIFNLNEVDSIHMYWNMGPHMSAKTHELVIRSWMSRKKMVFPFYLREQGFLLDSMPYYMAGYIDRTEEKKNFPVVVDNATQFMTFPWWHGPKSHWGMIGDGRCHMQTRDDVQAIYKQNWHPGPMENQMYRDISTFFYAQAYLQALKDVKEAIRSGSNTLEALKNKWQTQQPPGIKLPPPQRSEKGCVDDKACEDSFSSHSFCATAQQASWNGKHNLTAWKVDDKDSPYKFLNDTVGNWLVHRIKRTSSIGGAREREKEEEKKDPTCNGHSDKVVTWVSSGKPDGWITFRVPRVKHFKGQVILCTTRHRVGAAKEFSIRINGKEVKTVKREDPGGILDGSGNGCRRVLNDAPMNTEYISILANPGFGILSLILV